MKQKIYKKREFTNQELKILKFRKKAKQSKGEILIANFLTSNQIEFYTEFYFNEFKITNSTKVLYFDFYIPDYALVIEFDGEQHYSKEFRGKKLKNIEVNDFLKNAFCIKRRLHLLRIKYTDIDNIETIICKKFDKIKPI
jgi:very-short-patch-repair endonuclease